MSTIGSVNWEPESFDFDEYAGVTPLGKCIAEQSWDELVAEDRQLELELWRSEVDAYMRDMGMTIPWNEGIE